MDPFDSITLKKFAAPKGTMRELLGFALQGIGLASTEHDAIIDVVYVLAVENIYLSREEISCKISALRKEHNQALFGESTIRRALKQLRDAHFVERQRAKYRITNANTLRARCDMYLRERIDPIIVRSQEYFDAIDSMNSK